VNSLLLCLSCIVVCMRKTARGEVKVTVPGTGRININGKGLDFFKLTQSREAVITPLQLCGWLGKADVDAYVMGGKQSVEHQKTGGETARAGCVRWGIATAIAALGINKDDLWKLYLQITR
jgi:small subunit ribosomal protein S9